MRRHVEFRFESGKKRDAPTGDMRRQIEYDGNAVFCRLFQEMKLVGMRAIVSDFKRLFCLILLISVFDFFPLILPAQQFKAEISYKKVGFSDFFVDFTVSSNKNKYYDYKILERVGIINKRYAVNPRIAYITLKNFGNFPVIFRIGRQFLKQENFVINNAEYGYDGFFAYIYYKYFFTRLVYLKQGEGIYAGNVGKNNVGADKNIYGFESVGGDLKSGKLLGFHYFKEVNEDADMAKSYLGIILSFKEKMMHNVDFGFYNEADYMFGGNHLNLLNSPNKKKYRGIGVISRFFYNYTDRQRNISANISSGFIGRGLLTIANDSYIVEYKPLFYTFKESFYRNRMNGFTANIPARASDIFFNLKIRYKKAGLRSDVVYFAKEDAIDVFISPMLYATKELTVSLGLGNYFSKNTIIYTKLEINYKIK